jgi:glycosyltransferase involved in cell wall biosynthesis
MKILLASSFILPDIGGLWSYVNYLKHSLEQLGHEVEVLAHHPVDHSFYMLNQHTHFKNEDANKLIPHFFPDKYEQIQLQLDPFIKRTEQQRYTFEIAASHLRVTEYDIIHAQDIISAGVLKRVKPEKTPLILTIHGYFTDELMYRGTIKSKYSEQWEYSCSLEYQGITSSDLTIFPSNWLKNKMIQDIKVPDHHLEVIPNGLDIQRFYKEMNKNINFSVFPDKKIIACIARLETYKGHNYLFEALAKLKQERTDWICWIIGKGSLQKDLKFQCMSLGIDQNVLFLGNRNDVPALLKQADICVLPSLTENCPYAVMEAQVAGKTIIASAVGGIPEMIQHERTGLLTPSAEVESLYLNLKRMITEDSLRNKIAKNAKEWGRRQWSLDRMMYRTLKVYDQVLKKNH